MLRVCDFFFSGGLLMCGEPGSCRVGSCPPRENSHTVCSLEAPSKAKAIVVESTTMRKSHLCPAGERVMLSQRSRNLPLAPGHLLRTYYNIRTSMFVALEARRIPDNPDAVCHSLKLPAQC
jgi:hypothetical protein